MVSKVLSKFVALTHTETYISFVIHAPLAAAIVLGFHSWWAFALAASIGLWKDGWLDVRYGDTTYAQAARAELFYFAGAAVGAVGAGLLW